MPIRVSIAEKHLHEYDITRYYDLFRTRGMTITQLPLDFFVLQSTLGLLLTGFADWGPAQWSSVWWVWDG